MPLRRYELSCSPRSVALLSATSVLASTPHLVASRLSVASSPTTCHAGRKEAASASTSDGSW